MNFSGIKVRWKYKNAGWHKRMVDPVSQSSLG